MEGSTTTSIQEVTPQSMMHEPIKSSQTVLIILDNTLQRRLCQWSTLRLTYICAFFDALFRFLCVQDPPFALSIVQAVGDGQVHDGDARQFVWA